MLKRAEFLKNSKKFVIFDNDLKKVAASNNLIF